MKYLLFMVIIFMQGCAVFTRSNRANNYIGKELYFQKESYTSGLKTEVLKYDLDKMSQASICQKYKVVDLLDNTIRGKSILILDGNEGQSYLFMEKEDEPMNFFSTKDDCAIEKSKLEAEKKVIENDRIAKIKIFTKKNVGFKKYEKVAIDRQIQIGMPEQLLLLSWGDPDNINESVYSFGIHKQYVYGNQYVYTENGIITSWQNM